MPGRMLDLDGDEIELPVLDTTLGRNGIGKATDVTRTSLEHDALDAMVVIEMRMHRRDRQVMVVVLQRSQALGQVPLMMVVDVGEIGHAVRVLIRAFAEAIQVRSQDVTHGLGPVAVATALDQRVELVRQLVVERNREAFHAASRGKAASIGAGRHRK